MVSPIAIIIVLIILVIAFGYRQGWFSKQTADDSVEDKAEVQVVQAPVQVWSHKSACENQWGIAGVSCPAGQKLLVKNVQYGRPAGSTCPGPAGPCKSRDCTQQAMKLISGGGAIRFDGGYSKAFGDPDPCYGVLKQVDYDYTCS